MGSKPTKETDEGKGEGPRALAGAGPPTASAGGCCGDKAGELIARCAGESPVDKQRELSRVRRTRS